MLLEVLDGVLADEEEPDADNGYGDKGNDEPAGGFFILVLTLAWAACTFWAGACMGVGAFCTGAVFWAAPQAGQNWLP